MIKGYSSFCASVLVVTRGDYRCKHCPNFASFELKRQMKFPNLYFGLNLKIEVTFFSAVAVANSLMSVN